MSEGTGEYFIIIITLYRERVIIISPTDTDRIVQSIRRFTIEEVGTKEWLVQHQNIQKLNLQEHQNAIANSDPYVMESCLTYEKMEDLLHEMILCEAWREKVFPKVRNEVIEKSPLVGYFILFEEATLINFFEVCLFYESSCLSLGDSIIDLIDYCVRKIRYLNSSDLRDYLDKDDEDEDDNGEEEEGDGEENNKGKWKKDDTIDQQKRDIEYQSAVASITVLRYICEHISTLPSFVIPRILNTYDILLSIMPLLDFPPWTKRTNGKWYKYIDNKWKVVEPQFLMDLTKTEAQIWLIIFDLLCNNDCRSVYEWNDYRKETILRCRKYLNNILVDQLPVLSDVQRYLDELAIMKTGSVDSKKSLILEIIPVITEEIYKSITNDKIAYIKEKVLVSGDKGITEELKNLSDLYTNDNLDGLLEKAYCNKCGKEAIKKCGRCKNVYYCSRECQVSDWKDHKPICDLFVNNNKG